jgi:hypothetical protein
MMKRLICYQYPVSFILGLDPGFLLVLGELTLASTELGDTLPPSSGGGRIGLYFKRFTTGVSIHTHCEITQSLPSFFFG